MQPVSLRQAALALSLMLAAPALAAEPRVWDVPEALEAVDVPGRTVVGGVPVSMHAVRSRWDAASLQAHFQKEFKKAGLWLGPQTQLTVHRQVSGLDVDSLVAYSVFLQEHRDKTTTVVLSETFLAERTEAAAVGFAPVMPGASSVLQARTEGVDLVTYRVKAKVDEARGFYAETLAKAGWTAAGGDRFERGGEALEVAVAAKGGGEVAVRVLKRPR